MEWFWWYKNSKGYVQCFLNNEYKDDLKSFEIDKCNDRFENFYRLHNLEVDRFWHEPYAIANGYNGIFGSESFIEVH